MNFRYVLIDDNILLTVNKFILYNFYNFCANLVIIMFSFLSLLLFLVDHFLIPLLVIAVVIQLVCNILDFVAKPECLAKVLERFAFVVCPKESEPVLIDQIDERRQKEYYRDCRTDTWLSLELLFYHAPKYRVMQWWLMFLSVSR